MRRRALILRDTAIVALSILLAVVIAANNLVHVVLAQLQDWQLVASIVNGLFFSSIFTTAPSIVIFYELGNEMSPVIMAALGALGALLADLVLFRFVKDELSRDLAYLMRRKLPKKRPSLPMCVLLSVLGGVVIASPFPDEIGVALMGVTRMPSWLFVLVSYAFNFLGILIIASL